MSPLKHLQISTVQKISCDFMKYEYYFQNNSHSVINPLHFGLHQLTNVENILHKTLQVVLLKKDFCLL